MESRTNSVIGAFSDINAARMTIDELKMAGFDDSEVRLVENDQIEGAGEGRVLGADARIPTGTSAAQHEEGVGGFFRRLFGLDYEGEGRFEGDYRLSDDSHRYFTNAYEGRRHLVIVSSTDDVDEAIAIIRRNGGDIEENAGRWFAGDVENIRTLRLREEELTPRKEEVEAGEVRVRKEVVTETKTIEVPVTREEVVIERHAVSREGATAEGPIDATAMRAEEEIRIPVKEEEVHVEKRTVPREEVTVSKKKVQETKRVSEDLKREEAHVERTGRVDRLDRKTPEERPSI